MTTCTGGKEMSVASSLDRADEWLLSHLCDKRLEYLSQKEELTANEKAEILLIQELNMKLICNTLQKETPAQTVQGSDVTSGLLSKAYTNSVNITSQEAWYTSLLKRTLDVVDGIPCVGNVTVFVDSDEISISIMGHIRHDNDLACDVYEISFENLGGIEDFLIHVEGVEIALPDYLEFITEELPAILKKSL